MPNSDVIRALFTADCSLIVERDGRVSWCDPGASDLFGLEEGSQPGWGFPEAVGLFFKDPSTQLRLEDFPLGRILAGDAIEGVEICVRSGRTNGEEVWLIVTAEPVFSTRQDEVVAALVFCHDITGRKIALRGLEDAHAALQALVQASPLPMLALQTDGSISFWNRAAEKLFGWTEAEVIGRPLPFVPEESRHESWLMRTEDLVGDVVLNRDIRRKRRDGAMLDVSVSRAPIRDRQGGITGTICVYVDMTERRQIEERLRQSAKMESLGILAGGIAHDFNNLLTSILGNASLAMEDAPPRSDQARALTRVTESVDRAARLTKQMLAYAGQSISRRELVDLSKLVENTIPLIQSSLGRTVTLEVDLGPDLPLVMADAEQLRHVVIDLVLNAREAISKEGAVAIRTGAGMPDSEGWRTYIEVRDNGCGMDRDTQERMFDPFFSTKFTGRGLGLAAVLGIVRSHGGTISVESEALQGTSIRVSLPAAE